MLPVSPSTRHIYRKTTCRSLLPLKSICLVAKKNVADTAKVCQMLETPHIKGAVQQIKRSDRC